MNLYRCLAALLLFGAAQTGKADTPEAAPLAQAFGARPWVNGASISPDGKHVVFITAGAGPLDVAMVQDVTTGETKPITYADGKPLKIRRCGWSANDRLVCLFGGISRVDLQTLEWSRVVAMNADGTKAINLGNAHNDYRYFRGSDGEVIDWLSGTDGTIVMTRINGATFRVERVDTRTGKGNPVTPASAGDLVISDGNGAIRIGGFFDYNSAGFNGRVEYQYRLANGDKWLPFSKVTLDQGLKPIAVDGSTNLAYGLQDLNDHAALYSVALDGTLKTTLLFSDPKLDVDDVERIGRNNRVIGYRYFSDRLQITYTDPAYKALTAKLARALPKLPNIVIGGASTDEKKLLIFADSDIDPGHYFILDRDSFRLTELLLERPQLEHQRLVEQRSITYSAGDGTSILAYLFMPPDGPQKGLPALVMPHGGPSSRDVWGFDWLAQYFAARGYAVLQPEYRGSAGFGKKFLGGSGFKSWRTAIGDVNDAGRWLVNQGIADPAKLGIFGWSYGGYAALQANYLDPSLFKAVVAVAPVTELLGIRSNVLEGANQKVAEDFLGARSNSVEGSPLRHADVFKAPVLMFHSDLDVNVDINQSKKMDAALKAAGKQSRLVIYPGLDHQLDDSNVRADLLTQSDAFLRKAFGIE